MDIHQDLIGWLRHMGYNGEIPESLFGICNNSTKFVWEDLMQNVRPKQEVEMIKRNIILNRLKAKQINKQCEFTCKIQEIEDFQQKLALEEKLKLMKDMVQEKHYNVEKLSQNCKIKGVSIDFLKTKIKENDERKYLLDLKKTQLQNQNNQAAETLTKFKNVTPVEREDSGNVKEITETLEKCAEKLNKILMENQKSVAQNLQKTTIFHTLTQTKKKQDQSSVATYLSMREKEDFEEITRSCVKVPRDKENILPSNIQRGFAQPESKKRLFDLPQLIVEDTETRSFERLSLSRNSRSLDQEDEGNNQIAHISSRKSKKRESLGILPDYCFDDEGNESFLQGCSSSSPRRQQTDNVFSNSSENLVSFMSNIQQNSNDSGDSVVFNFNKNMHDKRNNKLKSVKVEDYYKKELHGDTYLNEDLEKLLHCNDRELLYEILQKLIQNVKVEFTKVVSMEGSLDDRKDKVSEDDITKLQFVHLQTELKIVHQKRVLKDLITKIGRRKLQLLSSIKSQEELIDCLDNNIKQVGLEASLAAMKKEINSSKTVDIDDNELKVLSSRILKVKNEIANKIKLIHITIEELYKTQKFLTSTRESVLSPIWHIRMFKTETEWTRPLLKNLWSEEIQLFDSFPLEYQRRCTFTDSKTYYRDMCTGNYPQNTKMEPEHLQMLSEILESPFSPPETILLDILKAKIKLQVLKRHKTKNDSADSQYSEKYSFKELQNQESYLEYSVDKLKAIMFSSNASKTLSIGDVIKKTMEIWTEMPMKDFISDKRIVDGQNYQYYQNKLNTFL